MRLTVPVFKRSIPGAVLLAGMLLGELAMAQTPEGEAPCTAHVWMKNGAQYEGLLLSEETDSVLVVETAGGIYLHLRTEEVKWVTQRCGKKGKPVEINRPYNFKEKGVYNHLRFSVLSGTSRQGWNSSGISFMHSIGYQFNRLLGAGITGGLENYDPGFDAVTYPLMLEVRSYWMQKRRSFYGHAAVGYAWAGAHTPQWSISESYSGGACLKAQIGYRRGNHFTMFTGISIQYKSRTWQSNPGFAIEYGVDKIVHKRLECGVGYLF